MGRGIEIERKERIVKEREGNKRLLEDYKRFLADEKKAAANTLTSYLHDLNQLCDWLEQEGRGGLADLTSDTIQCYADWMEEQGRSPSTITRRLASVRSFCKWRCRKGELREDPTRPVKSRPAQHKLPGVLTGEEVERLLAQPDPADPKGCRDHAMLELLYATGIRVSELIALTVEDVSLHAGLLHCGGKKQERVIPIYPAAVRALRDYLLHVRPLMAAPEETVLFVNVNGVAMSRQGFWKIVKSYQEKAGITADVTPKTLRHSFAAHLLENGASVGDVQKMLGHGSRAATQVYVRLIDQRLKDSYNLAHPMAQ